MLTNGRFASATIQYLEPNLTETQGRIRVITTVKPKRQTTAGLAGVLDLADDGQALSLAFTQYHPMPGAQFKFCIVRDEPSRLFWAAMNLPADPQMVSPWWKQVRETAHGESARVAQGGNDRRLLFLQYSVDGLNWFPAGCVAQAPKMSQSFMYPAMVIDGDDLAILCRAAINAPDQHDADYATFHRVKLFRALALDLVPGPEAESLKRDAAPTTRQTSGR